MDVLKSRPNDETTFTPKAPNSFQRGDCNVQNWIDSEGDFPPEPGRYHIFINYGCGWCHQLLQVLALRKLTTSDVSVTQIGLVRGAGRGTPEYEGFVIPSSADQSTGRSFSCMREVYNAFDNTYGVGQLTIPVLYDKKSARVVSNDPAQMLLMLDHHAEQLASDPAATESTPKLYPAELQAEIEAVNRVVFPGINNGVYCCWFGGESGSEAFEEGFGLVQDALVWIEERLTRNKADGKGPYLLGTEQPTLADVRAFPHLYRFDGIYVELMLKGRGQRIFAPDKFPLLGAWVRDLMFPRVFDTCDMQVATIFYFSSHPVEKSNEIYDREREASGNWLPSREEWAAKRLKEGMTEEHLSVDRKT